jgi:hypothetical protein
MFYFPTIGDAEVADLFFQAGSEYDGDYFHLNNNFASQV